MSISIIVGDEIYFKELEIKKCIDSAGEDIDLLTIDLDEQKKFTPLLSDMNVHLLSFDFFGKSKVGVLRTNNLKTAEGAIEYFLEQNIDCSTLIIDVFCTADKLSGFKRKSLIKNLPKDVKIEYFTALKNYEEEKLIPFVKEKLQEFNINFVSEQDYNKSVEYIVANSKLSFSCAYNEIRKLKFLNRKGFTYQRIVDTISDNLCTDRYYILDKLYNSSSHNEIFEVLNTYLPKFKKKDLEDLISDLSAFAKDYVVFSNTGNCMVKANYYKFKKLKFKIIEPDKFLIKMNKLLKDARKGNCTVTDYLFLDIFEHFVF